MIDQGPFWFMWVRPEEREGDTRKTDPTRPFLIRAGSYLRFGIGGYWGVFALEFTRPR